MSGDGSTLYVTDDSTTPGGIAVFSLNQSTGQPTQLPGLAGCITSDGSSNGTPGLCAIGSALNGSYEAGISPDGQSVYIASSNAQGVAVLSRESAPVCTRGRASAAAGHPISISLSCSDHNGEPVRISVVSGPTNGTLGPVNPFTNAVTYTPRKMFSGFDTFTFQASDGTNASTPATASISVSPSFALVGKPKSSGGKLALRLRCLGGRTIVCGGQIALITTRHHKQVKIGALHLFTIKVAHTKKLVVRLNARGLQLLDHLGRLQATATITLLGYKPRPILNLKTKIK